MFLNRSSHNGAIRFGEINGDNLVVGHRGESLVGLLS